MNRGTRWQVLIWISACLIVAVSHGRAVAQAAIDGYASYETLAAEIRALDESELVSVASLGKTLGGRDVFLITIAQGPPEDKPALLIVGNVEAPHLVGSELAMRVARQIAGRQPNPEAAKLLDRFTIYVIPRPSPDASERFFGRPSIERAGNDRATDDDRDGETDEDPPQDLNGDGLITMMRVEDESGSYLPHPSDSRVMIKADPRKNERGRYALYTEGRDLDGDEEFGEDGPGGVSFNRNFPHRYPYFEPLAGPHQVSEVETRAVADFAFAHPNIALVFTFSPEDNLMEPWKPNAGAEKDRIKTTIRSADAEYVNYLAEQYRQILGAKDAPPSPSGAGSFTQWAYYQYGRWSLAARGWWIPKTSSKPAAADEPAQVDAPGAAKDTAGKDDAAKAAAAPRKADTKADEKDNRGADDLNALAWFKKEGIDGFVNWTPVAHADFPGKKVEVGGFKPYLRLNPPAAQIDSLAEKHFRFLAQLAELMPSVQIASTEVKPLAGGLFRVTARVLNSGYLPTMSEMGRISEEAYPLMIKIELPPGAKLLTGHARQRLAKPLAGNGGKAEHQWLLFAPGPGSQKVTISVGCAAVNRDSKNVELK